MSARALPILAVEELERRAAEPVGHAVDAGLTAGGVFQGELDNRPQNLSHIFLRKDSEDGDGRAGRARDGTEAARETKHLSHIPVAALCREHRELRILCRCERKLATHHAQKGIGDEVWVGSRLCGMHCRLLQKK
jgi:hypothetical protein